MTFEQVAALGLAVFLLVCCVGEGCLLHDVITSRRSELTSKKLETLRARSVLLSGKRLQERKMSGSLYGSSDKAGVNLTQLTITRTDHVHLPSRQTSKTSLFIFSSQLSPSSSPGVSSGTSEMSLLSRLTASNRRSRADSSYSSMSSGRTSPSSIK